MPATREEAFSAMQESLDKIAASTAAMENFLSGTTEDEIEGNRAEKIRDKEQKKQTEALEKIGKNNKKEGGFFAKHWGKLLIGLLAIMALMMTKWKTITDAFEWVMENPIAATLAGLATAIAAFKAIKAVMKAPGAVARSVVRKVKTGSFFEKTKDIKPRKTPVTIADDFKTKASIVDETKKTTGRFQAEPRKVTKIQVKSFKTFGKERILRVADEPHANPNRMTTKITGKAGKFPGTSPLISDDMKANVARSRAQGIPIDKSKMPHKGPLDRPFWDTSQTRHDVSKAIRHGNAGGADLDAEAVKKSQKAQATWNQKVKPKLEKAAKAAEELEKTSKTGQKLKATGKGIGKTLGKIAKYAGPLIWADHWWENRLGHRSNVLGSIFGNAPLFESNITKPMSAGDAAKRATSQTASEMLDPTLGLQLGGDSADDTASAQEITREGKQIRSMGKLDRSSHLTADKVEKIWKKFKKKFKNILFGGREGQGSESIKDNIAKMSALNPDIAKLIHISGSAFSAGGHGAMRLTSGYRDREAQIKAMKGLSRAQYLKNYGNVTPKEWLKSNMSKHQHGNGIDVAYPKGIKGNTPEAAAFVKSINDRLTASGFDGNATMEDSHIHMVTGRIPTKEEALKYGKQFSAVTPAQTGKALQQLHNMNELGSNTGNINIVNNNQQFNKTENSSLVTGNSAVDHGVDGTMTLRIAPHQ